MANVTFSLSPRLHSTVARAVTQPWAKWTSDLAKPREVAAKGNAPMFNFVVPKKPLPDGVSAIEAGAIESMAGMVLDVDKVSPDKVEHLSSELAALGSGAMLYPTFNWSLEAPRYRVVIPYAVPLPVDQHRVAWVGASALLGLDVDDVGNDSCGAKPAQRFYVYSFPPGSEHPPCRVFDGPLIDPEVFVSEGRKAGAVTKAPTPADSRYRGHDINNELLYGPKPDPELVALGCAALRYFKDTGCAKQGERGLWLLMLAGLRHCEGGVQTAHKWSAKDVRYTPRETAKTMESLNGGPATCETISGEFAGCKACKHWKGGAA